VAAADAKTDGQIISTGSEFNSANKISRKISKQDVLGITTRYDILCHW
jgi:hypothetical protein